MSTPTPSITARAIVSRGPYPLGKWLMEDIKLRPPRDHELLIQIVSSGICHTDVHFGSLEHGFGVFYPRIMGHEGAGYVKEVGPKVTVAEIGDPVLLSFSSCEKCELCRSGHPAHCERFNPINFEVGEDSFMAQATGAEESTPDIYGKFFGQSSFASVTIASESSIVNVKGMVENDEELRLLSPLGCGIQTGSGTILNVGGATVDDRVAVLGLGGVGLSGVMAAKIRGCEMIIGIDRVPSRLALAKELGATHVINTNDLKDGDKLRDVVHSVTGGKGATLTMDTTGAPALIGEAIRFATFKGRVLQVGTSPPDQKLEISIYDFMVAGLSYIGAVEGDSEPRKYLPEMIQWVQGGSLPLKKIVKFYKAEDFRQAIEDMHSGETIKPIIVW